MSPSASRDRLVLAGRFGSAGGLGRALHALACHLVLEGFDLHVFSFGDGGPGGEGITIYPGRPGGTGEGIRIAKLCDEVKPRALIVMDGIEQICNLIAAVRSHATADLSIFAYTPLDGKLLEPRLLGKLGPSTKLVVYTHAAIEMLRASLAGSGVDHRLLPRESYIIGHGVSDGFTPFDEKGKKEARRRLFPMDPDIDDAFIVLNANRNQPRKRIDLTLKGFKQFVDQNPGNVRLLLHMERNASYDLVREATALGIRERLLLTGRDRFSHPELPDHALNDIYNAADVGINTSAAEAWGLVAFEHTATGAAQIMTDAPTARELWKESALFLPAESKVFLGRSFVGTATTPEHVANSLTRLYQDESYRLGMGASARANASQPQFDWGHVAKTWSKAMRGTLQPTSLA